MTRSSPTDRLADEFQASSTPPQAPDGGLQLEAAPLEPLPIRPMALCEIGPCVRYHELASRLDAQEPLDGSRIHLPVFVTRTCYPSPGIEIDLTQPVRSCNLWDPISHDSRGAKERAHLKFWAHDKLELFNRFEASWASATAATKETDDGDQ